MSLAYKDEYIPRYTYDDYKNWEGKWEIINGIAYAISPAPVIKHQEISGNIYMQLKQKSKDCKNCKSLQAVDWKIDEKTTICPDNLLVCGTEIGDKYLTKTPSIIFEILSPSTAFKDKNVKFQLYESKGVKYYIIVDGTKETAEIFELYNKKYQKTKNNRFILEGCEIDFDFENIWS